MERILITGSNGFIGSHLLQHLQTLEFDITTLNRQENKLSEKHLQLDLASEDWGFNPCENIDTVFHLAGKAHALAETSKDNDEYDLINTQGTHKLLIAAKKAGVERFIFFSSVKAVGDKKKEIQDELTQKRATTAYGLSKKRAERLVLDGGYVPYPVVIRPSMVYGKSTKGNLPRMISAIEKGFFPPLPEVKNQRSMIHVEDVIQAALLVAENPKAARQVYIVTDNTPYSTRQIYDWICEILNKKPISKPVPLSFLETMAKIGDKISLFRGQRFLFDSDTLEKLLGSACYSSAKIETELGFKAQYHLQQSLPEIIEYLAQHNNTV